MNSQNYWLVDSCFLRCGRRDLPQIITSPPPHCAPSVVALGTTKRSLKNTYVSFSSSSMNSNSSRSSLLDAAPLGIPGQKGQTPANHWLWAYLGDQEVGEQSCTFWFWNEKCLCLSAVGYHSNPNRALQWAATVQWSRKLILDHLSFGHWAHHIGISQYTARVWDFSKREVELWAPPSPAFPFHPHMSNFIHSKYCTQNPKQPL